MEELIFFNLGSGCCYENKTNGETLKGTEKTLSGTEVCIEGTEVTQNGPMVGGNPS